MHLISKNSLNFNLLMFYIVIAFTLISNSNMHIFCIRALSSYHTHNNARSPGYKKCVKWMNEIWAGFDSAVIHKSSQIRSNHLIALLSKNINKTTKNPYIECGRNQYVGLIEGSRPPLLKKKTT